MKTNWKMLSVLCLMPLLLANIENDNHRKQQTPVLIQHLVKACNNLLLGDGCGPACDLSPEGMDLLHVFIRGARDGVITAKNEGVRFLKKAAELKDQGKLLPTLQNLVQVAKELQPEIKNSKVSGEEMVGALYGLIDAEIISRGYETSPQYRKLRHQTDIDQVMLNRLNEISPHHEVGSFIYWQDLAALTDGKTRVFNQIQVLNTAEETVHVIDMLFEKVQYSFQSIFWTLQDDMSGTLFTDKVIAKMYSHPHIRFQFIFDKLTALRPGHNKNIGRLIQHGAEVQFSNFQTNPYFGIHRKEIIIDGHDVTSQTWMGSANIGDEYLHLAGNDHWRDTNMLVSGSISQDIWVQFNETWNVFARNNGTHESSNILLNANVAPKRSRTTGLDQGIFLSSHPKHVSENPILLATLHTFRQAKKSIVISNAYFIESPLMMVTIKDAIARGVKITVLANSTDSIDEKVISVPIATSLRALLNMGVEIYLKQGSTLHSKVWLVDDVVGMIGSYNFHPRSDFYEMESAVVFTGVQGQVIDKNTKSIPPITQLSQGLQKDILDATRITDASQLNIEQKDLWAFFYQLFRKQL